MRHQIWLVELVSGDVQDLGVMKARNVQRSLHEAGMKVTAYTYLRTWERVPVEVENDGKKFIVMYDSHIESNEEQNEEEFIIEETYVIRDVESDEILHDAEFSSEQAAYNYLESIVKMFEDSTDDYEVTLAYWLYYEKDGKRVYLGFYYDYSEAVWDMENISEEWNYAKDSYKTFEEYFYNPKKAVK